MAGKNVEDISGKESSVNGDTGSPKHNGQWGRPTSNQEIKLKVNRGQIIVIISAKVDVIPEAPRSKWADLSRVMALSDLCLKKNPLASVYRIDCRSVG